MLEQLRRSFSVSFGLAKEHPKILLVKEIDQNLRDAFEQLANSLRWYETYKKIFTEISYKNLTKKYTEVWRNLEAAGMTYGNLGKFIHEYMKLEASGNFDTMLEFTGNGSELLRVLKRERGITVEEEINVIDTDANLNPTGNQTYIGENIGSQNIVQNTEPVVDRSATTQVTDARLVHSFALPICSWIVC